MENQKNATVAVAPLSLPRGNGTVAGMGETLSGIGPDGMMALSLPLPISAGRGYAPNLSLQYNSSSGNGPFGMGWSCPVMSIARRTSRGVPLWQEDDDFIGPDGQVLIPQSHPQTCSSLRGQALPECTVTRYCPRVEHSNYIIERWVPVQKPEDAFWIVFTPDGGLHCLGFNDEARITHLSSKSETAVWLLQESVNTLGEHQYYLYSPDKYAQCDPVELANHPESVQRYLSQIFYGNIKASDAPFLLSKIPSPEDWLFCLAFDYNKYGSKTVPIFEPEEYWSVRSDCFSDYRYGFDLRTRYLCHHVLMYHRIAALEGQTEGTPVWTLCGHMSLGYDESAVVTTLVSITRHAVGSDTPESLPPLEFDWQEPTTTDITWSQLTDLENLNHLQPWQLVDLYGEGIPGILYQDEQAWWYCAPVRKSGGGVTWSAPSPLPSVPATGGHNLLMDITRDGRPDWVVTRPGVQGYFTMDARHNWLSFIPIAALPTEFFHPSAQLQDLTGNGNPDLVLIGPRSVRLWGATDSCSWVGISDVAYSGGSSLPVEGCDARKAVVFSDLFGSGQQHLAEIRSDRVTVWPFLGHGQFGEALEIPGFNVPNEQFNPSRLYLADTDGSGSSDILYVQSDRILLFLNQCGNRFVAAPPIMLPDGVRFDDSCQIQVADLQGLGVASVLLTVPHPQVQHWCCHLNTEKPWLLNALNNNMGTHHTFKYRSSAQFWLDEKQKSVNAVCRLPFPVHTLWQQTTEDEITGNKLSSEARYYQGVWDPYEREMRGFAYVEQQDTNLTSNVETDTPPLLTCSWYATGMEEVDSLLPSQYWQGDAGLFALNASRMTVWQNNTDIPLPDADDRWWLQRALRGCLLRSEIYGLDDSPQKTIPFSVSESRWQVRRLSDHSVPVVMPLQLESRSYQYERIASDPRISQTVNLMSDSDGIPVDTLIIHYPRRENIIAADYPSTLKPESIVADSWDEQQQTIYVTRNRARVFSFRKNDVWRVGLPDKHRTDAISLSASQCPEHGFSLENLTAADGVMSTPESQGDIDTWFEEGDWVFAGMQQVYYTTSQGEAPLNGEPEGKALVAFTESAVLDKSVFSLTTTYDITEDALKQWGYVKMVNAITQDTNAPCIIWGARVGYTDYGTAAQFWRPMSQRTSLLVGKTQIGWDIHFCSSVNQIDAAGLTTSAKIDYRFMLPVEMKDINDNQHQIIIDGFGRPVASRFNGTEGNTPVGYREWDGAFSLPVTVADALSRSGQVPLAGYSVVVADSWMQNVSTAISETFKQTLVSFGALEAGYQLHTLAWQRYARRHSDEKDVKGLQTWLGEQHLRLPPHQLDVTTDRYDSDSDQQQRQTIRFSDGMGRLLQVAVRHEFGIPEWQWMTSGLTASDGKTETERWAVSGRVEYNNKGLPVRQYQPFFMNDWCYVSDDSARKDLCADTLFYDAVGRHVRTRTANGYLRRTGYYPWFIVSEDENDTAEEASLPVS